MRKGRWILPVMILLALVGVVARLAMPPEESVYKGKPLSYWLEGFDLLSAKPALPGGTPWPTEQDATDAVKALGTNGVPEIMRILKKGDSRVRNWIWIALRWQNVIPVEPPTLGKRTRALRALRLLGPTASNAVPELIEMYKTDSSAFGQTASLTMLADFGPAAEKAVPLLLKRGVTHTNWVVRSDAIYALRRIRPEAKVLVPVLVKCLSDTNAEVQAQAAGALGDYGKKALEAVPGLQKLYGQQTAHVPGPRSEGSMITSAWDGSIVHSWTLEADPKGAAGEALEKIDPEAATKAGVKER